MAIADANIRKPITLPKALNAELCQEAEQAGRTLSEVIVGYVVRVKQGREQWEAHTEATLAQLGTQLHDLQETMRQVVELLEAMVKPMVPAEPEPEPQLPIATYEQMYGTAEEMGAQLRREQEARDAKFPQHDGQPQRPRANGRRWRWSWW
jgi:hypothetical protein